MELSAEEAEGAVLLSSLCPFSLLAVSGDSPLSAFSCNVLPLLLITVQVLAIPKVSRIGRYLYYEGSRFFLKGIQVYHTQRATQCVPSFVKIPLELTNYSHTCLVKAPSTSPSSSSTSSLTGPTVPAPRPVLDSVACQSFPHEEWLLGLWVSHAGARTSLSPTPTPLIARPSARLAARVAHACAPVLHPCASG
ncbi:hypothetical protein B0H19DRAFT_1250595 [Mycena capillaripes]|nr:hypothetical protein B0H19DRAFT_1250595 [Mycena capillaripes]